MMRRVVGDADDEEVEGEGREGPKRGSSTEEERLPLRIFREEGGGWCGGKTRRYCLVFLPWNVSEAV